MLEKNLYNQNNQLYRAPIVNIVLSDRGWILEKLARELTIRLPYVSYSDQPNPSSLIQYYITYSSRKKRVSPIEIAFFSHLEQDPETKLKFFSVSKEVDHCVCMSNIYSNKLRDTGIGSISTIFPGVDTGFFKPKLNIGVVGRAYHTGRKGETLVEQLMDIEWIELYFTGSGWPGPALDIPDEDMPAFYRKMDYVLVPSFYEGGPMCVIEALACGTQVIAPPIGWVPEFPHIEYETGNIKDLRNILNTLYQKKLALHNKVKNITWDNWSSNHDTLFKLLAKNNGVDNSQFSAFDTQGYQQKSIGIVLHGSEEINKGGPSVRGPLTVDKLNEEGLQAHLNNSKKINNNKFDICHIFNLWEPHECLKEVRRAKKSGQTVVLSPIFVDLSELRVYGPEIKKIFTYYYSTDDIDTSLRVIRDQCQNRISPQEHYTNQYFEYLEIIDEVFNEVDHVIFLSNHEKETLSKIGLHPRQSSIIRNPVNYDLFANTDKELFRSTYGLNDYILCVGRLEIRKNQLMLIHALREEKIPIVLVGESSDKEYEALVKAHSNSNVFFINRLEPNSSMLASAIAGSRVFCLPSLAEGASLAALEAAAAGASLVLSNRSSEMEYFGHHARYCDPFDPISIKNEILAAYINEKSEKQKNALIDYVKRNFSWDEHIKKTIAAYRAAEKIHFTSQRAVTKQKKIYIDLTSSANRNGPPTGIARVEQTYGLVLKHLAPDNISLVIWNSYHRCFVSVSYDQVIDKSFKDLRAEGFVDQSINPWRMRPYDKLDFEENSIFLILGGAWIRNDRYLDDVKILKKSKRLNIISAVYDVIQSKFSYWFPAGVSDVFSQNCSNLIDISDCILTTSDCSVKDIKQFCSELQIGCPPIKYLRLGDDISEISEDEKPQLEIIMSILKPNEPFVLCVSAIDIRKNHTLLYEVWRRLIIDIGETKTPHLILVGSLGWNAEWFLNSIERDQLTKNRIHVLHNISDVTLDWLYKNCKFTVYPSHYEGWGLPVAESLAYQKVCIAGSSGSVPEIDPKLTDLIDPLDFKGWYQKIKNYSINTTSLKNRQDQLSAFITTSWLDCGKKLKEILEQTQTFYTTWPTYHIGKKITFKLKKDNKSTSFTNYSGGGWYEAEKNGTWTRGSISTLILRIPTFRSQDLIFEFNHCAFIINELIAASFKVTVNGHTLHVGESFKGVTSTRIVIPSDVLRHLGNDNLVIDFEVETPRRPSDFKSSTDQRLIGIKLIEAEIRQINGEEQRAYILLTQLRKLFVDYTLPNEPVFFETIFAIILERKDVVDICFSNTICPSATLLFWIMSHGLKEFPELSRFSGYFKKIMIELSTDSVSNYESDFFPKMLYLIWLSRGDLQEFYDIESSEARKQLLDWFNNFGSTEYSL